MNENHDSETGQFTEAEPIVGREATEIAMGYEPYKEPEPEVAEDDSASDRAAEALDGHSTPTSDIKTYGLDLPENMTLTIEQAAKSVADARNAEAEQAQADEDARLRAEVDELRGAEQPQETKQPDIDPETVLEHPKVKEAIERATSDTEQVRLEHVNGLVAATNIAETAFFGQFPEFANTQPGQRMQIYATLLQNDPARAAQVRDSISNIASTFGQYEAENAKLTAERQIRNRALDAKFEESIKDIPAQKRTAIESSLVDAIKEAGIPGEEVAGVLEAARSNPYVRQMLWAWGSTAHRLSEIKSAPAKAIPKPVPPVTRPGTAGAVQRTGASSDIASLERQLASATGNTAVKLAAKLTGMRRNANGR